MVSKRINLQTTCKKSGLTTTIYYSREFNILPEILDAVKKAVYYFWNQWAPTDHNKESIHGKTIQNPIN